jgi:hypothetical protein
MLWRCSDGRNRRAIASCCDRIHHGVLSRGRVPIPGRPGCRRPQSGRCRNRVVVRGVKAGPVVRAARQHNGDIPRLPARSVSRSPTMPQSWRAPRPLSHGFHAGMAGHTCCTSSIASTAAGGLDLAPKHHVRRSRAPMPRRSSRACSTIGSGPAVGPCCAPVGAPAVGAARNR